MECLQSLTAFLDHSDTVFSLNCYIVSVDVTSIKVYKTILRYAGGEWYGEESQLGYATIRYLPSSNHIGVLPNEWVRGALPT